MINSISDIGLLLLIISAMGGTMLACWWFRGIVERIVNVKVAMTAMIFTGIALIIAFIGMKAGTLYINISKDPKNTVEQFYNCVVAGDYDNALSLHKNNKKFAIQSEVVDENAVKIKAAYEKSFAYEIKGDATRKDFDAKATVSLRYLSLEEMNKYIASCFESFLTENIQKNSRTVIYDGKNNYKQEFLDRVYNQTLDDALKHVETFYVTQDYEVKLTFADSRWVINSLDPVISVDIEDYAKKSKVDQLNNYLAENKIIYKSYKIEGDNVPTPNESNYLTVYPQDVDKVLNVISQAKDSGLLDNQSVSFRADANFIDTITCYYDESILVISWNEWVGGQCCSFSEIKIADASQFRRKVADDTYGSSKQYYCSTFAKQSNAVVAMNADFYGFRTFGTTVYDGEVKRSDNILDGLYVDNKGNFKFIERGSDYTREQYENFVKDNNIEFALAFGPVIIKDGQLVNNSWYPIGEINDIYSRAGIGQLGELHYLYLNVGHYNGSRCLTLSSFAQILYERGAVQAYNLDGGQTGELVMNNNIINYIDWGNERPVSDIIYFATAISE